MVLSNRYELKNIIGKGEMSVIYDGSDNKTGQDIIIKVTNIEDTLNEGKALRENDILMSLKHENIVNVYDKIVEGNKVYMIIEKVHSETLREYVRKSNMNDGQVLDIMLHLLSTFGYIHSKESYEICYEGEVEAVSCLNGLKDGNETIVEGETEKVEGTQEEVFEELFKKEKKVSTNRFSKYKILKGFNGFF